MDINQRNQSVVSINHTKYIEDEMQTTVYIYGFSILLSTILGLSIVLNILTALTIVCARVFTPINLLIVNLTLADLIYTLGIPMFVAHTFMKSWPFGQFGCKMFICTEFFGIFVGIMTVAALSVERYIEIVDKKKHPRDRFSNKFKNVAVVLFCAVLWILAFCFTMPFVHSIVQVRISKESLVCNTKWSDKTITYYFAFKFMFVFLIPYAIMLVSSGKLLCFLAAWKNQNSLSPSRSSSSSPSSSRLILTTSTTTTHQACVKSATSSKVVTKPSNLNSSSSSLGVVNKHHHHHHHYDRRDNKKSKSCFSVKSIAEAEDSSYCFQDIPSDSKYSHMKTFSTKSLHHVSSNSSLTTEFNTAMTPAANEYTASCQLSGSSTSNQYRTTTSKISTAYIERRLMRNNRHHRQFTINSHNSNVRQKAICLVLVIILLFFLQWSPLCIFQVILLASDTYIPHLHLINLIVSTLSYSNTVANPILYMLLTYNFKLYFRKTLNNNRTWQKVTKNISTAKTSI